jgi:uncharacterized damage-inducible protein DinB
MRNAEITLLFDYMYWVNHRLLDAAERLPKGAFLALSSGTTRDLRATLVHELDVEWSWRLNLQGRLAEAKEDLRPEDYPDLASLRARWDTDETEMRAWLASLDDDQLAAPVYSELTDRTWPLWQFLIHIVTHAAQQQADAATLLSGASESPGELGFVEFLRSREADS